MWAVEQAENRTKAEHAVRLALDRQQIRREQGIPTLGVLVGGVEEAVVAWQGWGKEAGWPVVIHDAGIPTDEAPGTAVLYVWQPDGEAGRAFETYRQESGTTEAQQRVQGTERWVRSLAQTVEDMWRKLDVARDDRRSPLALAVLPEVVERYLNGSPLDRARTFFAEGIVKLPQGLQIDACGNKEGGDETQPTLTQIAPSLDRQKLQASTVASFAAAREALHQVEAGVEKIGEFDRARSAAERFLADLLGELPETRGLFELNVRLPFFFGVKPAEVDLLAAGLRLAVEIDGYYHFRDQEGYRRDRRKDTLLQRHGYLVLRFLAEDVVTHLEEILEEIRSAVAFRRATLG